MLTKLTGIIATAALASSLTLVPSPALAADAPMLNLPRAQESVQDLSGPLEESLRQVHRVRESFRDGRTSRARLMDARSCHRALKQLDASGDTDAYWDNIDGCGSLYRRIETTSAYLDYYVDAWNIVPLPAHIPHGVDDVANTPRELQELLTRFDATPERIATLTDLMTQGTLAQARVNTKRDGVVLLYLQRGGDLLLTEDLATGYVTGQVYGFCFGTRPSAHVDDIVAALAGWDPNSWLVVG